MSETEEILEYKGFFHFETIGFLLNRLKDESETRGISIGIYKRLLSIMIEALENVFKYNEFFEKETSLYPTYYPRFVLEKKDGSFYLTTSNPILIKDIPRLTKHLENINGLEKEGLRQMFRDTLTNGKFSAKGGAGLGFIEMAKISGEKINFKFEPINEKYSYYSFKILIANNLTSS